MKFAMKIVLVLMATVASLKATAQNENAPQSSLLSQAEVDEIHERGKAEALEKEARRERDNVGRQNLTMQRQIGEYRARIDILKQQQQKLEAQIAASRAESQALQSRAAGITKELAFEESQRKQQEAEILKAKGQLDAYNSKLKDTVESLEKKKTETFAKIETNRNQVSRWNEEIALVQAEIIKTEMARYDFEENANRQEYQLAALQKKLDLATEERQAVYEESLKAKSRLDDLTKSTETVAVSIREQELARKNIQADTEKTASEISLQKKKLKQQISVLEAQTAAAEHERMRNQAEEKRLMITLQAVKAEADKANLKLAESQNSAIQSKLSLAKLRNELMREFIPEVESWSKKSGDPTASKEVVMNPVFAAEVDKTPEVTAESSPNRQAASANSFGKPWVMSKSCTMFSEADGKSQKVKKVTAKAVLNAEEDESGFVHAVTSDGTEGYIKSNCGKYSK